MTQIILNTKIHAFESCSEFAQAFELGPDDLVLTNKYIYEPHFGCLGLSVHTIFQEQYGTGEPTDTMVDAIIRDIAASGCRRIIAIGGGTVIDIAKVLSVAIDESVDELYARAPELPKRRELVIVPTTCGTGSEVTNIAIINRTRIGVKMGLVAPTLYAEHAALVPELLEGLPFSVFATSSIDALVHAVESALSPKATPYTRLFSYKAIEMILKGYQSIVKNGRDACISLLPEFLTASDFAGIAFGTAGCAAVHAISYPLSGKYHVPHGESNYAIFTGVLNNYMELRRDGELSVMNQYLAYLLGCSVENVYQHLEVLLNQILPKKPLREYGVVPEDLPVFTESVMQTQGRLMGNSFVPLDAARVLKIYQELY